MKPQRRYDAGRWQLERERNQIRSPWPDPPRDDPSPIGEVVGNIMRQFDAGTEPWLAELAMKWQDVAGDPVSRHTRPGHFEGSCLTVFVDSSAWLNELSRFGTEQMKENIQAHLDNDRVKTVRLRIDPEK